MAINEEDIDHVAERLASAIKDPPNTLIINQGHPLPHGITDLRVRHEVQRPINITLTAKLNSTEMIEWFVQLKTIEIQFPNGNDLKYSILAIPDHRIDFYPFDKAEIEVVYFCTEGK